VVCTDCHNPHTAKTVLPGNWLCIRCHNGSYTNAPTIDPVAHSRHKVHGFDTNGHAVDLDLSAYDPRRIAETGGECVNCHMPQTVYMQRHWRHDHGFTIPDPMMTRQYGIPNACNRCHADKTVAWAEEACEKWYGARMDRPTRRRAQWMARGRAGDAAAREPLLRVLAGDEIGYWRAAAIEMLEPWAGDAAVSRALVAAMEDTNALVRAAAAGALESRMTGLGSAAAAETLRRALGDPVRAVRVSAAWSLRDALDLSTPAGVDLRRYLAVNADQPTGRMQLGAWHVARQEITAALEHYGLAVAWDGGSAPIRHDYAVALSLAGRVQGAIAQLEAACRLEPRDAEYRFKLGLAWNEAGDLPKAVAAMEAAVRLEPAHARAWYNLGLAYSDAGRDAQALVALQEAERVEPSDARAAYARATVLARLGRRIEATAAVARALELDPGHRDARDLLRLLEQGR
jgi:tetratricopeptide (TPR) repeat protein